MEGAAVPGGWNWKSKAKELLHHLGVGKKPRMADERLPSEWRKEGERRKKEAGTRGAKKDNG